MDKEKEKALTEIQMLLQTPMEEIPLTDEEKLHIEDGYGLEAVIERRIRKLSKEAGINEEEISNAVEGNDEAPEEAPVKGRHTWVCAGHITAEDAGKLRFACNFFANIFKSLDNNFPDCPIVHGLELIDLNALKGLIPVVGDKNFEIRFIVKLKSQVELEKKTAAQAAGNGEAVKEPSRLITL